MIRLSRILPPLLALLLGACVSTTPQKPSRPPSALVAPPLVQQPPPTPTIEPVQLPAEVASIDIWGQLRDSFGMADCDADPSIVRQARRYTRHPRRFERQLATVLPKLAYVQKAASKHHVAGEFVLLPWVESHFRPVRGRPNKPAGMWQIMPITAGAMGLKIDRHYDGRLDMPAAADAVMTLLSRYHAAFHDWRVADYAYNAGEFTARRMVRRYGTPSATPVIPDWPVSRVTRQHLTRMLAMACIVRDPARFKVQLPSMPTTRRLVKVPIHRSMPLPQAARHAGMSASAMESLNAAFKNDRVDAGKSSYLMLPASHVKQFRQALEHQPQLAVEQDATASSGDDSTSATPTHKVQCGDSLWSIAHHYSVKVSQLKQWNHLQNDMLKPGRVLQVGSND